MRPTKSRSNAKNELLDLEELEEEDLDRIRKLYEELASTARAQARGSAS